MSVQRAAGEGRRGRMTKLNKKIADLYKEGKCRECCVNVTRMDFAKILGKFTKVKIQYESSPRPNRDEKKITSPTTTSRLRNNENGMVLIHRSVYKEHPAKAALEPTNVAPATPPARKRGRPPKNRPPVQPPVVTQYRIIFCERKESLSEDSSPENVNIGNILPALTADVLPTDEWLVDYLLQDEPTNDRVYDRIAAELEDLMSDSKPDPLPTQNAQKTDDFPSIMELLSDTCPPPDASELPKSDSDISKLETEPAKEDDNKMEVDPTIPAIEDIPVAVSKPVENESESKPSEEPPSTTAETTKVNGIMARVGDRNVDVQSINYVVFKRVKNDECNRIVKCSKNLDYSIEIDGRQVTLAGAPKYISCVDDLRLMLQIVHESDLSSFYVLEQH